VDGARLYFSDADQAGDALAQRSVP